MSEAPVRINLNENIKVKLNDYGKEIWYHQFDDLNARVGRTLIKPSFPETDADGYTSMQLHVFMHLYGKYATAGIQPFINPLEIVYEGEEE